MPLVRRRPASPRQLTANRLNAQKSTGPRTAAGKCRVAKNALKHRADAARASAFRSVMARLGEDPAEFDRLLENLHRVWRPSDPLQELLVQDLARVYWQKLRAERVYEENLVRHLSRAELEAQRELDQRSRPAPPLGEVDLELSGYRGAKDCPEKFQKCSQLLDELTERIEKQNWRPETHVLVKSLYGKLPDVTGARIGSLFTRLLDPKQSAAEIEVAYHDLRAWLARDKQKLQWEKETYDRRLLETEIETRQRARVEFEWRATQESGTIASMDRHMAGKIRLLIALKRRRNATKMEKSEGAPGGARREFRTENNSPEGTKPPGAVESKTSLQKQTQTDQI